MPDATFRGDCGRCAALCCLALSFERGPHFAFDKAADEPCAHLGADDRCAIHERLVREGMSGCVRYDCAGAGQLATALFAGLNWRHSPAIRRQMLRIFSLLREIQLLRLAACRAGHPLEKLEQGIGWTLPLLLVDGPALIAAARAELATALAARRPGQNSRRWSATGENARMKA